ncbi:putative Methyltransferase-related protein [Quillaja saponaria]|uniref:Methyltransferase-related protein n=1 Tax=Quillaja saponaria TaxID=32244 RepID=A0AAD7PQZ4_QUISA|nr:putative Methyltransferase-related protein [Quillaja saponaria]
MCPLRLILIFLSATLAGFFVLRNLKSQPHQSEIDEDADNILMNAQTSDSSNPSFARSSKVRSAIESGFWTCVDMASGRYLWRHLVSSSSKGSD